MSEKLSHKEVLNDLKNLADPERAKASQWFFKTGKGQYGEWDRFLGIRVPVQRKVAEKYKTLPVHEVVSLLKNPYHEARLTAALILVNKYHTGDETAKKLIYETYLANTEFINNWDIVDSSAHKIVGPYLSNKPEKMKTLEKLAKSSSLWERRIAMVSTAYNIGKLKSASEAIFLAELLLNDEHDLMHKAVGWMLREVGKNIDQGVLIDFLDKHAAEMPRTMLRYSIERLDEPKRKHYLSLKAT